MIELPQGYYLTNFLELVDYVHQQYSDLLSDAEAAFFQDFKSLGQDAQFLYLRMLTRKGLVFRQNKLSYQEITNLQTAVEELVEKNFVRLDPPLTAESLLPIFSKTEWLNNLSSLELDNETKSSLKKLSRKELDVVLLEIDEDFNIFTLINEPVLLLEKSELFETFKLLFFGNLNQDLTEFVLRDLGLYQFEDYLIDKQTRLFSDRRQIETYLNYYQTIDNFDEVIQQDSQAIINFNERLPNTRIADNTLNRRVQRIKLLLARQLERLESFNEAIDIYQECQLEPSRERQARIYLKQANIDENLQVCQSIINSPLSESEQIFAEEFGFRSAKKFKLEWPKPKNYKPETEIIRLEQSEDSVEVTSMEYFQQYGQCFYVENGLFLSLFGLHFWEVIFAPIKGAFTNPFQYRPHDLYDDDFLKKRESLFQKIQSTNNDINKLHKDYLNKIALKTGIATPFVFWDLLQEDLLTIALERIPSIHWQAIFDRIWADIRANRSGFPDLILFPETGGYQLIEIKGPGDKLQKNQLRWMSYFSQHQIPHKVVHVEWQ